MSEETDLIIHLQRIEDLLSALVKKQLSEIIEKELCDKNTQKLYDLTGKNTARELEKKTGFSIATISRTWQRWEKLGLIIKETKGYRKVI